MRKPYLVSCTNSVLHIEQCKQGVDPVLKDFLDPIATIVLTPLLMFVGHGSYSHPFPDLKVENKGDYLELSGTSGDSGRTVCRVTKKRNRKVVIVDVHWLLCGSPHPLAAKKLDEGVTLSGLNHYKISISKNTERVLFGKKRVVIWERKEGIERDHTEEQKPMNDESCATQ